MAFTVLLERKVLRGIQLRTGPMNVGILGILQTIVDRIKLLTKGVIGSKVIYFSGIFVLCGCLINLNTSVMYLLVLLSLLSYLFLRGVFFSECLYSILRGLRAIMSILSYEILLLICLLFLVNV